MHRCAKLDLFLKSDTNFLAEIAWTKVRKDKFQTICLGIWQVDGYSRKIYRVAIMPYVSIIYLHTWHFVFFLMYNMCGEKNVLFTLFSKFSFD